MINELQLQEIEHKSSNFVVLTNRLRRYWNRLVKESLAIARDKGLEVYVAGDNKISFGIKIKKEGDYTDAEKLIELARKNYASLYRRYTSGMKKHDELKRELEEIYMRL